MIRLWSAAGLAACDSDVPRGVARHVGTGRAAAFRDGGELLALLREAFEPAAPDPDGTPAHPACRAPVLTASSIGVMPHIESRRALR